MVAFRLWLLFFIALTVLASCSRNLPALEVGDAGGPAVDASAGAHDEARRDGGTLLRFGWTVETSDGQQHEVPWIDAGVAITPPVAMQLFFARPLIGARVRVMDWTDAVVASDDETNLIDGGFVYRSRFQSLLKAGRQYTLLIDPETGDHFEDSEGHAFEELRVRFRLLGEVQAEQPKSPKKRKR